MSRQDPLGNHYFSLELEGAEVAHFTGCSGLKMGTDVFEIEEGGVNDRVHKFPSIGSYDNLVLRILTGSSPALWSWREAWVQDDTRPASSGAVTLRDLEGNPVIRYEMTGIWPVRWSGPDFKGDGSDVAVEELELAFEDLKVVPA